MAKSQHQLEKKNSNQSHKLTLLRTSYRTLAYQFQAHHTRLLQAVDDRIRARKLVRFNFALLFLFVRESLVKFSTSHSGEQYVKAYYSLNAPIDQFILLFYPNAGLQIGSMELQYGCKVSNRYMAFLDTKNGRRPTQVQLKPSDRQLAHLKSNPIKVNLKQSNGGQSINKQTTDGQSPIPVHKQNDHVEKQCEQKAVDSTPTLSPDESKLSPDDQKWSEKPDNQKWSEMCLAEEEELRCESDVCLAKDAKKEALPCESEVCSAKEEALPCESQKASNDQPASVSPPRRAYPTMYFYNQTFRNPNARHRSSDYSDPSSNEYAARKSQVRRKRSKRFPKLRQKVSNAQSTSDDVADNRSDETDAVEPSSLDQARIQADGGRKHVRNNRTRRHAFYDARRDRHDVARPPVGKA